MSDRLGIRRAGVGEDHPVIEVLAEAGAFAAARGFAQWPARFSPSFVRGGIERGEVYLAFLDDVAVATCWLLWSDPQFWGVDDGLAGYLHRLAVTDRFRGQRLGQQVLDWAGAQVRQSGRRLLRLDCLAANRPLRSWYERYGFVHQRDQVLAAAAVGSGTVSMTVSLYQLALGPSFESRTPATPQ
ncbi:MAG: GNAT family N-acetyltransferase [Candidatus Dormibacteria bacterium]